MSPQEEGQGFPFMMLMQVKTAMPQGGEPAVFDRAHLAHYTMGDQGLEAEIISLFLAQLPATIEMIEQAQTPAEWKLATHTLKGSAAAVGAFQLRDIALSLEGLPVNADPAIRAPRFAALSRAVAVFREQIRAVYP